MKKCISRSLAVLGIVLMLAALLTAGALATEDTSPKLDIYAANLSFEDAVYLMYAVDAENVSADQVTMLFWTAPILQSDPEAYVKGTEAYEATSCGDVEIDGVTYTMFKYNKLYAYNMTDVIYARAYVEVEGEGYYSELSKYSILQYAYNKLGYTGTATDSTTLQTMLNNMLAYGASAQAHFEYKTDRLATAAYYEIQLVGGVMTDGATHGLFLAGEEVEITAAIEGFVRWTDADGYTVSNDVTTTMTVGTTNTTYIATDVDVSTAQNKLEFTLNDDGNSYTVTGIGTCTDTDIIIPQTYEDKPVTAIGDKAFSEQTGITSITLPGTIKAIGTRAFYGCTGLTEFTVPASVTSIGTQIFYKCSNLTTVYYNSTYSPGQSNVILNTTSIKKVVFGGTAVPSSIAYNCANLTEVEIKSSVKKLNSYAFYGCSKLTTITIPDSVTTISNYAFYGCSSLTSITIPDSVTSIGSSAFEDCSSLTNLYITDLAAWCKVSLASDNSHPLYNSGSNGKLYLNGNLVTELVVPNSVTSIGKYTFYGCRSLTSVNIPDSVTSIGSSAFFYCNSLTDVYVTDVAAWLKISFGNAEAHPNYYGKLHILNAKGNEVTELVIPDGTTAIGNSTFRNAQNLTSVTIPDSVTSIGEYAFFKCSRFTSVIIPDSVTSIGSSAFWGCSSLTSVIIPDSVTTIGNYAFRNCSSLTSITIPDSVTSIGQYAFSGCTGLTSVTIGNSVTSIGDSAFSDCSSLTSVTIPDSVTSIGLYAFYNCTGLTSITIPFAGASLNGTSNTHFGYIFGANSYSSNANYVPTSLKTVVITGEGSIGERAFYRCTGLTSIIIPDSVTTIGYYAFSGCTGLASITIPDSVTSIGSSAFEGCSSLTSITIPDSVTSIGDYAFCNCTGLSSVTIPDSVTSIGQYTFYNCSSLTNLYITDLAAWCKVSLASGNSHPLYNSGSNGKLYLNGNLVTELVVPNSVTSIGDYAFQNCSSLTSVNIPDSVTSIGYDAFRNCSSLTSITIPDSVTSIGQYAFSNCTGLTSIIIPDSVTSIGYDAFYGCTGLTSVTIGNSVTSIGNYAFRNCSSLTSITIPDSVTSIGQYAFSGCTGLTSVTIGNSVASIGDDAFSRCYKLAEVINHSELDIQVGSSNYGGIAYCALEVHNGTSKIVNRDSYLFLEFDGTNYLLGYVGTETELSLPRDYNSASYNIFRYAFYGCTGLTSVTIPDSVTTIGNYAFYGCTSLTSVTIPDSVTSIGNSAFEGCSSLTTVYYGGAAADWSGISINVNYSELRSATRYYYSETAPTEAGNYWHWVDGKPTIW